MSTIKRIVLCVALLTANGLRFGDRALDPREDVDAASSSKEDFASRLAVSAGKAVLLADADTTLQEAVDLPPNARCPAHDTRSGVKCESNLRRASLE